LQRRAHDWGNPARAPGRQRGGGGLQSRPHGLGKPCKSTRTPARGGGSKAGIMTGTTLQEHGALIAVATKVRHNLLLQVANGKQGTIHMWKCETSHSGSSVFHRFRATNAAPIDGVRNFEAFLLDHDHYFVDNALTTAAAEAPIVEEIPYERGQRQCQARTKISSAGKVRCVRGQRAPLHTNRRKVCALVTRTLCA
jgi:hypothetical protein